MSEWHERYDWFDDRRKHWRRDSARPVIVEAFRPGADEPRPTILLSHGTGAAVVADSVTFFTAHLGQPRPRP
ncbi:hypothetical protein AB0J90_34895 [Micromonospora sp. NPDC049523]|uniref:hypothetical protein n=1 Tax=Micromonospora sp. NPDC049523 TaxID=3155921 RepID=UPI0034188C0D